MVGKDGRNKGSVWKNAKAGKVERGVGERSKGCGQAGHGREHKT